MPADRSRHLAERAAAHVLAPGCDHRGEFAFGRTLIVEAPRPEETAAPGGVGAPAPGEAG